MYLHKYKKSMKMKVMMQVPYSCNYLLNISTKFLRGSIFETKKYNNHKSYFLWVLLQGTYLKMNVQYFRINDQKKVNNNYCSFLFEKKSKMRINFHIINLK